MRQGFSFRRLWNSCGTLENHIKPPVFDDFPHFSSYSSMDFRILYPFLDLHPHSSHPQVPMVESCNTAASAGVRWLSSGTQASGAVMATDEKSLGDLQKLGCA